jgi:S-DNA-T family DNA segregation ATPase FtsK/SpoIIIE
MPHLLTPIITDPQKAAGALCSAVSEMEKRFELIERVGARDIKGYKKITAGDPDMPRMPHIVIIIDELADLMMTASNDVEAAIMRIAQKARAAGIHLIIGTQRPSVDVITGTIKANIPSRIACTVASQTDSRTILDAQGAEKLCGRGDMLFAPVGASRPRRVQGSFVSDDEVIRVVNFMINNNGTALYDEQFMENINLEAERCLSSKKASAEAAMIAESDEDPKFGDAVMLAIECGKISTSLLQRRLEVGYGRAAKIIDRMEELGYVSEAEGNKPRKILVTMEEYLARASGEMSEE